MAKKVKATLYIPEDVREKIRRTGLSLEEYFNRLYDKYEKLSLDKWRDGVFTIQGYFRVSLIRAETLNLILDKFEDEELVDLGRELGKKLRLSIQANFKHYFDSEDNFELEMMNHLNNYSGWGYFTLEKDTIVITMPIFTKPHLLQGYLEGLLNLTLTPVESYPDRITFKTK
mgnify:CR=1 FL=1